MSHTIIRDESIKPFYISKDQYCYTVMEVITPDKKNLGRFGKKGNKNAGKDYEKSIGHFNTLSSALRKISKEKIDNTKDYDSIGSYIKEYESIKQQTEKLLNKIEI